MAPTFEDESSLNDSDTDDDSVFENEISSDDGDNDEDETDDIYSSSSKQAIMYRIDASSGPSHRIITLPHRTLHGKNNQKWVTTKVRSTKIFSSFNAGHAVGTSKDMCLNIIEPINCFELFITDQIVEVLVKWTNQQIKWMNKKPKVLSATYQATNKIEIKAFIGILTMTAFMKDNHLSMNEMFNAMYSGNRYICVMSKERFEILLRCLRMEDKSLRTEYEGDAFAPIRNVWNIFMEQCRENYEPGTHLTVDESLIGFRGRCAFRTKIRNKPNEHGIKMFKLCDSSTNYLVNALPYFGKNKTGDLLAGEYFIKELTKTIHGTKRNITCGKMFTSIPLAKDLLKAPYELTLVGSIKKCKKEIPKEIHNFKGRPVGSSIFCFDGPLTLVSYKITASKMTYILSSCDEDAVINEANRKPEMIAFYNQTKSAVNSFKKMCASMSCSRKTNSWPMAVFFAMLNMAFVNSYIIYCKNMKLSQQLPLTRNGFMKSLSLALTSTWMAKRLELPTLSRSLREGIIHILPKLAQTSSKEILEEPETKEPKKRRLCKFCHYKKKRMTKTVCYKCRKPICGEHNVDVCYDCTS